MYDAHYGLTDRPFQLTPDPRFWYETATHRKAMAYLGYGLAQGEGFIVITGDIGAGKTTLVGHLMATLDTGALNVIKIVSTAVPADDLLRIVAIGLGVDPAGLTKAQLLTTIERGLHAVARSGRRTLLIVDEAQALPVDALEELRMLSNFQAGGHALLQILLLGQPEFRERLHGSERLEQLRQRVIAIHHLDPMEPQEVADYVAHRLAIVGWQGRPDFAEDAFEALYHGSGGVPRRLNLLAGRVMLHAAIEGLELIDGRQVRKVMRDLHADLPTMTIDQMPVTALPVEQVAVEPAPAQPMVVESNPAEPVPAVVAPKPQLVPPAPKTREESNSSVKPDPGRGFVPRTDRWREPANETDPARDPAPLPAKPGEPVPSLLEERVKSLEARVEEQDAALRRVLTLLVDWVEADRGDAATASEHDPMSIRPPAAWDNAA